MVYDATVWNSEPSSQVSNPNPGSHYLMLLKVCWGFLCVSKAETLWTKGAYQFFRLPLSASSGMRLQSRLANLQEAGVSPGSMVCTNRTLGVLLK